VKILCVSDGKIFKPPSSKNDHIMNILHIEIYVENYMENHIDL